MEPHAVGDGGLGGGRGRRAREGPCPASGEAVYPAGGGGTGSAPEQPVQVRLEDDGGGRAVDDLPPRTPAGPRRAERSLGLDGGKAFVLELDGDRQEPAERLREALGQTGALPRFSRELQRVTEDDEGHVVLADQLGDGLQVRRGTGADRSERHRQPAFRIGDRDADPGVAEVQAEDPALPRGSGISHPARGAPAGEVRWLRGHPDRHCPSDRLRRRVRASRQRRRLRSWPRFRGERGR